MQTPVFNGDSGITPDFGNSNLRLKSGKSF